MKKKEGLTAIVTGGSSGIGRAVCESLAQKGVRVYEFSRRNFPNEGITHYSVDVTDEAAVNAAVSDIISRGHAVDILVNCAGFGIAGAAEFTKSADARRQLEVNFFGTVKVTQSLLGHMREKGSGRVVNVSSVAAEVPIPFQTYYSVSKAAVNSYTAALANEVRPYGISVCAVMPGDISSGFTDARKKNLEGDASYGGRIEKSIARMEKDERGGMSPGACGKYIAKIALKRRVKPYYSVGFAYKLVCVLMKLLPCGFANRIIYKIYAG